MSHVSRQSALTCGSLVILLLACEGTPSSIAPGVGGATLGQGGATLGQGGAALGQGGATLGQSGSTLFMNQGGTAFTSNGTQATGGTKTSGGTGGTANTGGTQATGGTKTSGGTGSTANTGGTQATGGTSASTTLTPTANWPTCNFTDSQIQTAYNAWSNSYIATCAGGGKRVTGCGSSTCSEGMGYGMLIAVNAGHRDLFDAFWLFVDSLIPVPAAGGTVAGNNLLPWSIKSDCSVDDYNNATDGDLDVAMSLIQADKRWPGNGYLDRAIPIIKDILNKNTAVTNGKRVLLTGAKQKVADGGRPSYFAPAYYRVFIDIFSRTGYADAAQVTGWTELLNSTYSLLSAAQAGTTGKLWPDWWPLDGSTSSGQAFGWDACRAPWRIATDYAWFASSEASAALLAARTIQPNPYVASPISPKNSAQVGALAFTAMPAGSAAFQTACDQWMQGPLSDGVYFQDSLKLIYMQLAGGFFPSTL